jgi:acetyltransferase
MFNTAKGFEDFPAPKGNRIAVVTNAGGPAILTVDTLEKNNLALADLNIETKLNLKDFVHPEGSINNPVDLLPGGTAEQFKAVNEILARDKNVDAIISVFVEPIMVKALPVIEAINDIKSEKPIFQVVMPLPEFWQEYRTESKTKRALFKRPEDPAVVINNLLKFQNKKTNTGRIQTEETTEDFSLNEKLGRFLTPDEVKGLCGYYKLPIVKEEILSFDDLNKKHVHYPLVLKAVGEKIVHKTDLKGVVLNIESKDELIKTAEEMIWNFSAKNIQLDSFLIQPFLKTKFELLVGAFRDPSFGPMIMFGSGGKYVEYLDDTVMRSSCLTENDIDEMINSTKIGKIIQGVRGEESVDIKSIKSAIKNLAQMMVNHKEISEVDLNPLLITFDNKIFAVDVRIKC